MTLEIRISEDPDHRTLYDETGEIGWIGYQRREDGDDEDVEEGWVAALWGFRFGAEKSSEPCASIEVCVNIAHELYGELLKERRYQKKISRNSPTRLISTPMGGQPPRG